MQVTNSSKAIRVIPLRGSLAPVFITVVLATLLTSGCSLNRESERPVVTLQSAKSATMANERDMAAVIAPEDIVDVKQNQGSHLLQCSNGERTWTGKISIQLAPGADGPSYVQAIGHAWMDKDDWTVIRRTTALGQDVVDITNPAGYTHGVDYSSKFNQVRVMSFSPCFAMDPPYEYGLEY